MDNRIHNHVVIDTSSNAKTIEINVDGKNISAKEGEPILAALLASGIKINRHTEKRHEPRGLFCGIGHCTDCSMVVNGQPNVRTCITPAKEGMQIKTQEGIGKDL